MRGLARRWVSMGSRTDERMLVTPPRGSREPRRVLVGAALGLLAGGVAIGAAQLVAGIIGGLPGGRSSPVVAVGGAVIDAAPRWLKDLAIRTFGTHDKLALLIGIGVLLGVAAIVLGIASVRRPRVGEVGLLAFGAVGLAATLTRSGAAPADALPSLIGVLAGIAALRWLRHSAGLPARALEPPAERASPGGDGEGHDLPRPRLDRRRFLVNGLVTAGAAAFAWIVGQSLVRRSAAVASRAAVRIPRPSSPAPALPAGADLRIPGLSSFVTPNASFYRVDTAILAPAVDAHGWSLRVHGMVDRELTLDYEQLLRRPLIERDVTLTCVSNEVGGGYVGNARWIGASLRDLLEEAGVHPGATQIVSRSVDGFTAGTPTAVAMDGRDAMLAVAMNGDPLPLDHGFPVRMIVPGLYGYVSATKWLVDLELTRFEDFTPYWVRQGWSDQAPIKTESRIDTPRDGASLPAGPVAVAGVAWAQHRGIAGVEVRVDDGPWTPARLAVQDTIDTWRQWVYRWDASSGSHTLQVRAADDTGVTQTAEHRPPFPDGATGYHTISVTVA